MRKFQKINYKDLSSKQQENYNFHKVSSILADYGFTTIKLYDDWKNADFIAQHNDRKTFLKVQLKNRFWQITDSNGSKQEVRGEGVVGEQPILNPGEKFEYTSGTPLSTPSGFMEGYYEMETKTGNKFDASIPLFSLDSPHISTKVN